MQYSKKEHDLMQQKSQACELRVMIKPHGSPLQGGKPNNK